MLLENDPLGDGLRGRYLTHLFRGEESEAAALEAELEAEDHTSKLAAWGRMYQGVDGVWSDLSTGDVNELLAYAYGDEASAGALSWATLLHIGALDSLPYPEVPSSLKSLWMRKLDRNGAATTEPLIGVVPNPAGDRIAFIVPEGTTDGLLEVFDAQGNLVRSIAIGGRKGLVEDNVKDLKPGLYAVRLMLDGFNLGSSKFTVMR